MTEERGLIVLESIDTDLIVRELEGRAVSQWAYSFDQEGARVTGLTVAGVEQCSREAAKQGEALRILKREWHEMGTAPDGTPLAWFAVVEVGRFAVSRDGVDVLLDTAIGTKQEKVRKYSARKKRWYENPNALDVAISKAARNAKRKLLDPALVERVLQAALLGGRTASPTDYDQAVALAESKQEALPAPDPAKIREDAARAAFYATAKDLGLTSQLEVHNRLALTVGLVCRSYAQHDVSPKDRNACHALREAVEKYAETTGPDKAAAWGALTEQLAGSGEPEGIEEPVWSE